jgi:glyoxylase-like metal-dependent hydrolase (beta-lactamase superfamily II)
MFKKGKPGLPMFADNIEKLHKSIRQVISLSPQIVYTGHGGPFTMEEIQKKLPE